MGEERLMNTLNTSKTHPPHHRKDWIDFIFRALFSSIFIGLGGEHLVDDHLIMNLMPDWVPEQRLVSVFSGMVLLSGGTFIILGFELKKAALLLSGFLIAVTVSVHGPALFSIPSTIHTEDQWLWIILQRSNFVKNLCLLGVCFHLYYYEPRCFSLHYLLKQNNGSFQRLWQQLKKRKLKVFR